MRKSVAVRLLILAILCATIVLVAAPAGATTSAPIRECGNQRSQLAFNITTRRVSCLEARRVVRVWGIGPARRGGDGRVRGLFCRYRDTGYEAGDIRCTGSGGRVVRWQTAS